MCVTEEIQPRAHAAVEGFVGALPGPTPEAEVLARFEWEEKAGSFQLFSGLRLKKAQPRRRNAGLF